MIYFVRVVGVMKGLWCFCIGYSESFKVWVVVLRDIKLDISFSCKKAMNLKIIYFQCNLIRILKIYRIINIKEGAFLYQN